MQEIFFFDDGPPPLPKDKVHIASVEAHPYPDGTRVQVAITLSPFLEKPNLAISITDQNNDVLVSAEILEPISITTEITLHIKPTSPQHIHTLTVNLYYEEAEPQDSKTVDFHPIGEDPAC